MSADVLNLFSGIGADLGIEQLGLVTHGIDNEPHVAATRERLGMATTLADITTLDPGGWVGVEGLWASPPCTDFSRAGKGAGIDGETGRLVFEPLRWVEAIRPRWVAMEQVVEAGPAFRSMERDLEAMGYRATVVRLSAEEYGVPQTRERVYLMAHRDRAPRIPPSTHQPYVPGVPCERPANLFGLLPWVSMAEALGLDKGLMVDTRCAFDGRPVTRSADAPALTVTSKIGGQWTLKSERRGAEERRQRSIDEPAPTLIGHIGHTTPRDQRWMFHRPATTVARDERPPPAGHHDRQMNDAITTAQGCRLMAFPDPDRVAAALPPTKRAAWQIIGNAVASPMARIIVEGLAS